MRGEVSCARKGGREGAGLDAGAHIGRVLQHWQMGQGVGERQHTGVAGEVRKLVRTGRGRA